MDSTNTKLSSAARLRLPHQEMPLCPAEKRITNFDEVPIGYSDEQAHIEAMRCLQCEKPLCVGACPVGVNIRDFIKLIEEGNIAGAAEVIHQTNFLPAACGRVCPQDKQCQAVCKVGKNHPPVGIGNLERYVADHERAHRKAGIHVRDIAGQAPNERAGEEGLERLSHVANILTR